MNQDNFKYSFFSTMGFFYNLISFLAQDIVAVIPPYRTNKIVDAEIFSFSSRPIFASTPANNCITNIRSLKLCYTL